MLELYNLNLESKGKDSNKKRYQRKIIKIMWRKPKNDFDFTKMISFFTRKVYFAQKSLF